MTTILTVITSIALVAIIYCTYRREQSRKRHQQTRTVLRDADQSEADRNRKMIEQVRASCEYDVNNYSEEEWR